MSPLPAPRALDQFFLDARSRLLDLAGMLDRIDRGDGAGDVSPDARMVKIREALRILLESTGGRAERVQQLFSLAYDPNWPKPKPR